MIRAASTITHISVDAPVITLINVFTVRPERQRALIDLLETATEEVMRHQPGFVSANLHRSLDGQHVANYAQWTSREAFEAMLRNPEAREHMTLASAMAEAAPVLYEVAAVYNESAR